MERRVQNHTAPHPHLLGLPGVSEGAGAGILRLIQEKSSIHDTLAGEHKTVLPTSFFSCTFSNRYFSLFGRGERRSRGVITVGVQTDP